MGIREYREAMGKCLECGDGLDWHKDGKCEMCSKIGGVCQDKEAFSEALPGGAIF